MAYPRDDAYHTDSDADDEFERSMTSPNMAATDSDAETDTEPPSNQHTPTTFELQAGDDGLPKAIVSAWTTEECNQFLNNLGLRQYCDTFTENEIDGEALVALKHEELKEMGIASLGHRLSILKNVYDLKVKQDVPVDSDDFVPLSAEHDHQHEMATKEDITRVARSIIRLRDERIAQAEAQLTKLADDYRRLRQELLPVFKMAKERSEPLPYAPHLTSYAGDSDAILSPPTTATFQPEKPSLSRSLSKKLGLSNSAQRNHSPTHIPSTLIESKTKQELHNLNPSAAATQASNQLSGAMHQQSPAASTLPSPTSPLPYHQPLAPRTYQREPSSGFSRFDGIDDNAAARQNSTPTPSILYDPPKSANQFSKFPHTNSYNSTASTLAPSREQSASVPPQIGRNSTSELQQPQRTSSGGVDSDGASADILKSFRVALEDPCYKVLPAALKKYNIQADWRQYALYIVYGDQERCVRLDEKPLALFKDLGREGKNPMFMLRKLANPIEVSNMPGSAGLPGVRPSGQGGGLSGGAGVRSMVSGNPLPGGVL